MTKCLMVAWHKIDLQAIQRSPYRFHLSIPMETFNAILMDLNVLNIFDRDGIENVGGDGDGALSR